MYVFISVHGTTPWQLQFAQKIRILLTHLLLDKMVAILANDIFKRTFLDEDVRISIEISLKFVPKGPINNIPASVQIMAWCRPDDKLLSEPMMVKLPTHMCVPRP